MDLVCCPVWRLFLSSFLPSDISNPPLFKPGVIGGESCVRPLLLLFSEIPDLCPEYKMDGVRWMWNSLYQCIRFKRSKIFFFRFYFLLSIFEWYRTPSFYFQKIVFCLTKNLFTIHSALNDQMVKPVLIFHLVYSF